METLEKNLKREEFIRVAFATHVYFKDYSVVLDPKRFSMVLDSHCHEFSDVLIVLNNFKKESDRKKAETAAKKLIKLGLATHYVNALSYLTDDILREFGLDSEEYWQNNPYFSSAQISALHWLRGKADYLLHMAGDVWLRSPINWISSILPEMEKRPNMLGFNLCRAVYEWNFPACYPNWSQGEDDFFWLSYHLKDFTLTVGDSEGESQNCRGWGLSDLAYFIRLSPSVNWDFGIRKEEVAKFTPNWVQYARPCFEMYLSFFMYRSGFEYGTLKPQGGRYPLIHHKNFPSNKMKRYFYQMLGRYYQGGRYATHPSDSLK